MNSNSKWEWLAGALAGLTLVLTDRLAMAVFVLVVLMILDIVSGLSRAVIQRKVSSDISCRGMVKKVIILIGVMVAIVVEGLARMYFDVGLPVAEMVVGFFCVVEAVSVLENMTEAGVPVPGFLRSILARLSTYFDSQDRGPDTRA